MPTRWKGLLAFFWKSFSPPIPTTSPPPLPPPSHLSPPHICNPSVWEDRAVGFLPSFVCMYSPTPPLYLAFPLFFVPLLSPLPALSLSLYISSSFPPPLSLSLSLSLCSLCFLLLFDCFCYPPPSDLLLLLLLLAPSSSSSVSPFLSPPSLCLSFTHTTHTHTHSHTVWYYPRTRKTGRYSYICILLFIKLILCWSRILKCYKPLKCHL